MRAPRSGQNMYSVRPFTMCLAVVFLIGCAGAPPAPRMPPEVPTALPSEIEAARVHEGAGEVIELQVPIDTTDTADTTDAATMADGDTALVRVAEMDADVARLPEMETELPAGMTAAWTPRAEEFSDEMDSRHELRPQQISPDAKSAGYRVQVFATSSKTLAQQHAARLRPRFDEKVYVDFEAHLYKVRVGDCVTITEAETLRRRALDLGQEGAFVVNAQVILY